MRKTFLYGTRSTNSEASEAGYGDTENGVIARWHSHPYDVTQPILKHSHNGLHAPAEDSVGDLIEREEYILRTGGQHGWNWNH